LARWRKTVTVRQFDRKDRIGAMVDIIQKLVRETSRNPASGAGAGSRRG